MFQWLQRVLSGNPTTEEKQARQEAPPAATTAPPAVRPAAPVTASTAANPTAPPTTTTSTTSAPPFGAAAQPGRPVVSFEQADIVDGRYYNWLFDTDAGSDIDTSSGETEVLDALSTIINSKQSGSALVRRMPGLIPQLMQSLRSDNFSGAALARTISSDPVLVASVIRLANISMRGTGKQITSVEHAVMVVGQEGLRQLITSVAFRPIIDMNSGQYTRQMAPKIWDRSERTAVANRALAESMGVDPFEAFLAGLVQNVGLIVTLRIMDQAAKEGEALGSPMFVAKLLQDARTLTCSIGKEWNFPDKVTLAVSEQGAMGKKAAHMSPLGRLLALNDYLGKLRILVENGKADRDDPLLFKGLPSQAEQAYEALAPIDEE